MEFAAICLGNPGPRYAETRHNAGFFVARRVAERLGIRLRRRLFAQFRYARRPPLVVVTPLTYMNRSGEVLPSVFRSFAEAQNTVLVVFDQMDLPMGSVRLKRGGGAGGHRGVQSVIDYMGDRQLLKLAVGIGRPATGESVTDYVLAPPAGEQEDPFHSGSTLAADVVLRLCEEDVTRVMNDVNSRVHAS